MTAIAIHTGQNTVQYAGESIMSDNFWENYNKEFAEKEYIYADYLKAIIKILNPKSILEVGSGAKRNLQYIPGDVEYTGIDLIDGHDITNMEADRFYDLVLCTGVFCHIEPKKRKKAFNFMVDSGEYLLMIEPYTKGDEEMHEWHGMKDKLWTVDPEKRDPMIFTELDGGYSLSLY